VPRVKSNYDFSKGIKNPYAQEMEKGYTVMVHYDSAHPQMIKTDKSQPKDKKRSQKRA